MRRIIPWIALGVVIGGAAVWLTLREKFAAPAGESTAAEESTELKSGEVSIGHDTAGNVVIHMSRELQATAGIAVTNLEAVQLAAEVKGYGRVLDPAELAALYGEFTTAQAARESSDAELQRLRTLAAQNNASARALQAAEAAAARDQAQFESARLKWIATGCSAMSGPLDFPGLMKSLGSLESALVRVDLPAGERLPSPPTGALLRTLSGGQVAAEFLGEAPMVDPQTQSRGFLFLVRTNAVGLAPGAAVTGYLATAGELSAGVVVPRSAVLRHEGLAWIYLESQGTNFTRRAVSLDRPLDRGWFVPAGGGPGDHVVSVGAQTLLSEELTAGGFLSGERD